MRMNLQKRSVFIIAFILFLALSINTAVLTYIAYNRYKQAVLAKATSVGEATTKEIGKLLALGTSLENIEGLNEKLKGLLEDKTIAYSMVLNKEGKILFHTDEASVGKAFRDSVTLKALDSNKALIQNWGSSYDISLPLLDAKGTNVGILRVGVKSAVIKKELYNLLVWTISISAVGFLLFAAIIYFSVSRFITAPIMEMEKVATRVSSGDLTETVKRIGKDEMASLSDAINSIALNLRDVLFKIRDLSKNVYAVTAIITESPASVLRVVDLQKVAIEENARHIDDMNKSISSIALSSESLHEMSEEASSAATELTASIAQVAENANVFNETSIEAAASIEEMIASIKETANSLEILSTSSEESASALSEINATVKEIQNSAEESVRLAEKVSIEASEKGLASITTAIKGIEDVKDSMNAISETINRLEKRSEEIGSIVNVIDEVAGQTSLLSLNAAILAAQAGEHGKSFTVVADEIKRLAERTSASTKEISGLITAVQTETRSSVEIADKGIKTVDRGVKFVRDVNDALNSIVKSSKVSTEMSRSIQRATAEEVNVIMQITDSIKKIISQIEHISRATKEQNKGSNLIVEAAEMVKTGSEQIKRTTEEQFKSSKQISIISDNVSKQAEQITFAINSQKQKSAEIVSTMEKIQKTTADLIASATEMDRSISSLSKDAKTLLTEIQKFKV